MIVGGRGSDVAFETLKSIEFFNQHRTSFRAEITEMNKTRYLVLSKFFLQNGQGEADKWVHTHKQIFLPPAAWLGLVGLKKDISAALRTTPSTGV